MQVVGEGEESIIVPHVTAVEVVRVLNLEDFEEQQEEQESKGASMPPVAPEARVCGKLSGKLFELFKLSDLLLLSYRPLSPSRSPRRTSTTTSPRRTT